MTFNTIQNTIHKKINTSYGGCGSQIPQQRRKITAKNVFWIEIRKAF
jgi:hypothetical protein